MCRQAFCGVRGGQAGVLWDMLGDFPLLHLHAWVLLCVLKLPKNIRAH